MSRFAPLSAVLLLGSAACLFEPPAADPPIGLEPKDADIPDRSSDPSDGSTRDASALDDTGVLDGGANRPPIALADSATIASAGPLDIPVLSNDSDPDGDPLTITGVDPPSNGTATRFGVLIRYAPSAGFEGNDTFTYRISDGRGGEGSARVDILVGPFDPPVLLPISAEMNLNSRGAFSVTGGVPPRTFRIASGAGEIDPVTGTFFSPGIPGSARVVVEDAVGQIDESNVTFGNGYLFFLGGFGPMGDEEDVYRSSDGMSWQRVGGLPTPLYLHSGVVFEDQIFIAGGRNQSFEASQLLLVSTDGVNWSTRGMLPAELRGNKLLVFQQQLFLIGGRDGSNTNRDEVWASQDGTNWALVGRLPAARAYGAAFVHGGELWYAGGSTSNAQTEVWASSDGAGWTMRGSLPQPRYFMAHAIHEGEMWLIGGSTNGDDGDRSVWHSADAQSFSTATDLPSISASAAALVWRGDLWVVGGGTSFSDNPSSYDSVLTMAPSGMWAMPGSLPQPRFHGAMVIFAP